MFSAGKRGLRRTLGRVGATAGFAAILLAVGASPASASVTIGQVGTANTCTNNHDVVQVLSPGASYVVPNDGTIISWSTQANATMGTSLTMKIFRLIAAPNLYLIVGHDGPRTLAPSALNTFPANVAVKRGDVLGINLPAAAGGPGCVIPVPTGDLFFFNNTNLADGATGNLAFNETSGRLNINAVFNPTSAFTIGAQTQNKKKGTTTLDLILPNPGDVTVVGKGVKAASGARTSVAVQAGTAKVVIKAKGKKKKKLNSKRKVVVTPKLIYTPTGGDPFAQTAKVKLQKKKRKKP